MMTAGAAAMIEKITTSRICSFDPASPLRRPLSSFANRRAISPASKIMNTRSRLSSQITVFGSFPNGGVSESAA